MSISITKYLRKLFGEPSAIKEREYKITPLRGVLAVLSNLACNPIGVLGIFQWIRFLTWEAGILSVIGFIFGLLSSSALNSYLAFRERLTVLRHIRTTYKYYTLCEVPISDHISISLYNDYFSVVERKLGKYIHNIYKRIIYSAVIFEYDLSASSIREAKYKGEAIRIISGPRAFVDTHGYAYIFVPKSRGENVYRKFLISHEVAHAGTAMVSGWRPSLEPLSYFALLLCLPIHIIWNIPSILLYSMTLIMYLNYFSPKDQYIRMVERLSSETIADSFAVEQFTHEEKKKFNNIISKYNKMNDNSLSSQLNIVRKFKIMNMLNEAPFDQYESAEISISNNLEPIYKILFISLISLFCEAPSWSQVSIYVLFSVILFAVFYFLIICSKALDKIIVNEARNR